MSAFASSRHNAAHRFGSYVPGGDIRIATKKPSLDHFVRAAKQCERKGDAQRPGSFHVDDTGEAAQSLVNRSHLGCH
jgi:hypothetical protein